MKDAAALKGEFAATLLNYVESRNESALGKAYELGRSALAAGMGVLEIAGVQHEAQVTTLRQMGSPRSVLPLLEACQRCSLEALSAFEMTHRGFQEANAVLRHFNDTLEGELKQIAHVLHGETGQLLVAVNLEIGNLERQASDWAAGRLQRVKGLLARVEDQLRHLTHEIRPTVLDDLGLVAALEFLRDGVEGRNDLRVHVQGPPGERFPQPVEVTVYRIVQEALNNVMKHALASRVTIQVRSDRDHLVCSIQDDGSGFDVAALASTPSERGFGLLGMKQRVQSVGGTMQVHSAPGQGTGIVVSIPLVH